MDFITFNLLFLLANAIIMWRIIRLFNDVNRLRDDYGRLIKLCSSKIKDDESKHQNSNSYPDH